MLCTLDNILNLCHVPLEFWYSDLLVLAGQYPVVLADFRLPVPAGVPVRPRARCSSPGEIVLLVFISFRMTCRVFESGRVGLGCLKVPPDRLLWTCTPVLKFLAGVPSAGTILGVPGRLVVSSLADSGGNMVARYHHGNPVFKYSVSAQNLPLTTVKEEKEKAETESSYANIESGSIETLTRFYKEAILAEDYQTIAEIETSFYQLQNVNNELVENISTISEEITAGKARYIRLQADFDNFRRRSEKERLSVRRDAQGEVIESLLPMMDNFERAKLLINPETAREKQIDTSYQGIYKQFVEIMRSLRVSIIATVGKPFDPSLHEAIAREDSEEYKEGIVSQELRRGFILGDRLLRPAMVKVSSGPSSR
ncbi:hypothetical protein KSS87_004445 [Heliosperma pusillum]|nr:hypothetical protein KSS87_004445 [Heliosperma pusillum]